MTNILKRSLLTFAVGALLCAPVYSQETNPNTGYSDTARGQVDTTDGGNWGWLGLLGLAGLMGLRRPREYSAGMREPASGRI